MRAISGASARRSRIIRSRVGRKSGSSFMFTNERGSSLRRSSVDGSQFAVTSPIEIGLVCVYLRNSLHPFSSVVFRMAVRSAGVNAGQRM